MSVTFYKTAVMTLSQWGFQILIQGIIFLLRQYKDQLEKGESWNKRKHLFASKRPYKISKDAGHTKCSQWHEQSYGNGVEWELLLDFWEREWEWPIPKFWECEWKLHSQHLGTGTGMKSSFLIFGNKNGRPVFLGMVGNRNAARKLRNLGFFPETKEHFKSHFLSQTYQQVFCIVTIHECDET